MGAALSHPDVVEAAVVGMHDDEKGEVPVAIVVRQSDGNEHVDQLRAQVVQFVRDEVGPVAALKKVCVVSSLPKTKSGKILRRVIKQLCEGTPRADIPIPGTIEDPDVLPALEQAIIEQVRRH